MTSSYPANADTVIVQHYWWNDATRAGVNATVSWTPIAAAGGAANPNLVDATSKGWVKTQTWVSRPDPTTGYMAVPLTASNDPDLTGFAGYQVAPQGETSFTIAADDAAATATADQAMVDALAALTPPVTISVGASVKAVWLTDVAQVSPSPSPPASFFTADQTTALVVDGIAAHDTDPDAHPDIRALIGSSGGGGESGGPVGYHHEQPTALATWTVPHHLGFNPAGVMARDATGLIEPADVTYPDTNTCVLAWAVPVSGSVDLS